MKITGNTILITGGGSGIGRGLAEAFHASGNKVIIASRREHLLKATIAANPGMEYLVLDQESASGVRDFAREVQKRYPKLNVLINNAGIQRVEDLTSGELSDAEATIAINLLGPIRLTAALIRHLMSQPHGAILNVSSTLAMVPGAGIPTYCDSKEAIHSYTQSLRFQLRDTPVQVIEILPPWLQTELQGERIKVVSDQDDQLPVTLLDLLRQAVQGHGQVDENHKQGGENGFSSTAEQARAQENKCRGRYRIDA